MFAAGLHMLSELKQYFYNPLCFGCGSLFVEDHLFCTFCFESQIQPRMFLKERTFLYEGEKIKHFYLFEWIPGESDLLSAMVYQLKSDRCVKALKFFTNALILEILEGDFQGYNCVLPLPGSTRSSSHSYTMANQVSKTTGLIKREIFRKEKQNTQQKKLNSQMRQQLEITACALKRHELFTSLSSDKLNPIYVDDILTTGSTLKAAIKALDIKQNACVVTLFYRPVGSVVAHPAQ